MEKPWLTIGNKTINPNQITHVIDFGGDEMGAAGENAVQIFFSSSDFNGKASGNPCIRLNGWEADAWRDYQAENLIFNLYYYDLNWQDLRKKEDK